MSEAASARVARRIVRALVAGGLRELVYCPGSRDAPFAYALHAAERAGWLRVHVRLDERAAGFTALGLAKASALVGEPRPVAVVTTSGTAVANLHPALCEADASGAALVACTADRPHEMWGTGANQTTRQLGLFGPVVRRVEDIPADFPDDERLDALVTRALAAATGCFTADPGPVHLNVCFREPLVPAVPWRPAGPPSAGALAQPQSRLAPEPLAMPARSLVVAGDGAGPQAEAIARAGGWPLLAEPSSAARFGPNALTDYQGLLGGALGEQVDGVVVLGHPTLSRPISRLLARRGSRIAVVASRSRWTDVAGLAEVHRGPVRVSGAPAPASWLDAWQTADRAQSAAMDAKGEACAAIWREHCVSGAPGLVIGASEVIRAFDRCARPGGSAPLVIANRGLGGIDGTLATAVGAAGALHRPVRAVVGDLTAAHDGLGLLHGTEEAVPDVQVVVLADRGGAIFAGLEHAGAEPSLFRRYFLTPQALGLAALARAVGAGYRKAGVGDELIAALREPIRGTSIVEVTLPRLG